MAGTAGFEPTISESKSGVLPLHYIPMDAAIRDKENRLSGWTGQPIKNGVGDGTRTHGTRNHNPVL